MEEFEPIKHPKQSRTSHLQYPRTDGVSWGACEVEIPGIECANFIVPLDYTDTESQETLDLKLLKVPTVQTPKNGSIFFNFGGPGLGSRGTLASLAPSLLAITGGEYDLVAFDPPGTIDTITASCFNTTIERAAIVGDPSLVVPSTEDILALGRLWGQTQVAEDSCFNYPDLIRLVDAIEDDGLLRFWGISYGTVLGATVAAMFPVRIDRVVLDAVPNPHEYLNSYDLEVWADSDRTFFGLLKACLQAPEGAYALAHLNPISHDGLLIDSGLVQTLVRFALYSPDLYPALAHALDALLSGDAAVFAAVYSALSEAGVILTQQPDEAAFSILCGDKVLPRQTYTEMAPVFEKFEQESRFQGKFGHIQAMICQHWRIQAKGRYERNFETITKYPLLVVGNTYDSATPLRSAQNVTASFEGAVLLEHGGFGHGFTTDGSSCTINAVPSYFSNGTLPKLGTVCEVDYAPFTPGNLTSVLEDLGYLEALPAPSE
ncbi:TAP-like protein-domain-containing protein [Aspergillus crustosus]